MPPRHVIAICRATGHWPERAVVSTRPAVRQGVTVVTLTCGHDVERGKRPKPGSLTFCEVCARWEGVRQRAALDLRRPQADNPST